MQDILNRVHFGDAYALMAAFPAAFVDCTVTSVPYWQQREYLPEGHKLKRFEMGCESTIEKYLADMKDLFAQVHRITKPSGSLWLNVGDKYASGATRKACPGYAEGELLGIPWRLAEAVRSAGWRLISEVIWHKTNPMPGGARRRPGTAHEHTFLFVKGKAYYYDGIAIAEPSRNPGRVGRGHSRDLFHRGGTTRRTLSDFVVGETRQAGTVWSLANFPLKARKFLADIQDDGRYLKLDPACPIHGDAAPAGPLFGGETDAAGPECACKEVDGDFFAAMPPRLAERCILASTSEMGNCPTCGAPMARLVRKERAATRPGTSAKRDHSGKACRDPLRHVTRTETIGWRATCDHTPRNPARPVVFDPFVGSGTTPMVARATGRDYLGTELNPACARTLAPARIAAGWERSPVRQ